MCVSKPNRRLMRELSPCNRLVCSSISPSDSRQECRSAARRRIPSVTVKDLESHGSIYGSRAVRARHPSMGPAVANTKPSLDTLCMGVCALSPTFGLSADAKADVVCKPPSCSEIGSATKLG